MVAFIRLDDDFPVRTAMPGFDDKAPLDEGIVSIGGRHLEHAPELDLGELAVHHPPLDMRRQLELPLPPSRPGHAARMYPAFREEGPKGRP